ncbi:MAG TPA: sulfate/molybdate ABC transporter ATP-binding protein [Candidatus Acidoferrales bacterium]
MALEVAITKRLPDFTLEASFNSSGGPLGILGPSGAGKTMLLRCIAGLERPDRGRIVLEGRTLFDSERNVEVPARGRGIGMLFQSYALFPHRNVEENIAFGIHGLPRDERSQRVNLWLQRTHSEGVRRRYPHELSGGEQQRAALARALSIDPDALLLDEPLSALDTHLRSQMEAQLQETFADYRRPALLVTHNIEEAYRLGEKLLVLSHGHVAALGGKEEIFRRPPTLEVARLTGCKNFSRARAISADTVEAIDWGCRLRLEPPLPPSIAHVGIRAHHIDFEEASSATGAEENVFPCRLIRLSETPFRVTLYLRLGRNTHDLPDDLSAGDLQAEVYNEKWERFRDRPMPWHVRLSPEFLFPLPG